jgi:hypothetical protein
MLSVDIVSFGCICESCKSNLVKHSASHRPLIFPFQISSIGHECSAATAAAAAAATAEEGGGHASIGSDALRDQAVQEGSQSGRDNFEAFPEARRNPLHEGPTAQLHGKEGGGSAGGEDGPHE